MRWGDRGFYNGNDMQETITNESERGAAQALPERYNPAEIEPKWQARWDADPALYAAETAEAEKAEVLLPGDAAVPERAAAHGACAELCDWRCAGAVHVDDGAQCAPPDGLGCVWAAGGECGAQEQHASAGVDAREHCGDAKADAADGVELRLGDRGDDVSAGVLPVEPVVLPEDVRAGAGVPQEEQGELVSEVLHGAGE